MKNARILEGNCLDVMREMEDCSVDAIVTDPPYGLKFMAKKWDHDVPRVEIWREALRVLKPGGHLLAFFGSRTYHRGVVNIEDAGFDIRDQIMWVYGSGFPKSSNVSKAIDRAVGATREVVGEYKSPENTSGGNGRSFCHGPNRTAGGLPKITAPATPEAEKWDGWGTALKPAHEPIVMARKPFKGPCFRNVLEHGTGAINIDDCRVLAGEQPAPTYAPGWDSINQKNSEEGYRSDNYTQGNAQFTPSTKGRWPANLIHDGSEEVIEQFPDTKSGGGNKTRKQPTTGERFGVYGVPSDDIRNADQGSAARFFYCAKASRGEREKGLDGIEAIGGHEAVGRKEGSKGMDSPRAGAGRTSKEVRNKHPTVKPIKLMEYLVKLVTPPGGVVFDPFTGSGTTGIACALQGFEFIGAEMDPDYCKIARARIEAHQEE